jgi:hypothetical protein
MEVYLEAVNFNHDHESVSADAFNIRKNEMTPILLPEWEKGRSVKPEDSPAAYSLSDTRGHVLTIKARFSCSDKSVQQLTIRAILPAGSSTSESVLGEVGQTSVTFTNGASDFTLFELKNTAIWSAGIGVHDILWIWQYREKSSSSWIEFARSSHRIYTTLNLPQEPWVQKPFDSTTTHLVWTDVLDRACKWAKGVLQEEDEASAAIVREVFALGPEFLQFDKPNNGSAHYSDDRYFDCTALLLQLAREKSNGPLVNCSDCAAIVGTFANALGSTLSQARMGPPRGHKAFPLSTHQRIGLGNVSQGGFRYHEVGWKGSAIETDDVFDACLVIDGDDNPCTFTARSAADLPFTEYRLRLVGQAYGNLCLPVENSARHRLLGPAPRGLRIRPGKDLPPLAAASSRLIREFNFVGDELPGFRLERSRRLADEGEVPVVRSFWVEKAQSTSVLRIDAYECSSAIEAGEGVVTLLDEFQLPGMEKVSDWGSDVFSFANSEKLTALFAVANIVFLVRNVGETTLQISTIVTSLRDLIAPNRVHRRDECVVGSEVPIARTSPTVGNQQINLKGDNVMSSVFDGDWHSYAESGTHPPELDPDGLFHFEVDAETGDLRSSNHDGNPIEGHVNRAISSIEIRERDPETGLIFIYEGVLVYQGAVGRYERYLACGRYILPPERVAQEDKPRTLRNRRLEQEQGTWVITKP